MERGSSPDATVSVVENAAVDEQPRLTTPERPTDSDGWELVWQSVGPPAASAVIRVQRRERTWIVEVVGTSLLADAICDSPEEVARVLRDYAPFVSLTLDPSAVWRGRGSPVGQPTGRDVGAMRVTMLDPRAEQPRIR